jgi:hypothetical protein
MVPVRTHWGRRGKSRIDPAPGRQSGTATPPTAQQHIPPPHPLFPCQLIPSDLGRGRKGAPQRLQLLFQARVQGTRSVPEPNSGRRPEPGACERTPVRQPAQPSTTPESHSAHTRQASCVLTGARDSAQCIRRPRRRVIRLGSRPTRATHLPVQPQTRVLRG